MNVPGLYGTYPATPVTASSAVSPSGTVVGGGATPSLGGGAATVTISTPGKFFSEMQYLSQQDPGEFKAVAAQVATNFQTAANQAVGVEAQFLTHLANQFTRAAQTGSLQPPEEPKPVLAVRGAQDALAGRAGRQSPHPGVGASAPSSSDVQQAFLSAMSVLGQATQGTALAMTSPR